MSLLLEQYFPLLHPQQRAHYEHLQVLCGEWNERLNLISRKDFIHFSERHLLHSLALARVFSLLPGMRVIDLGTGGGFPGLPLAIFFPKVQFVLVDSVQKKIQAVTAIAEQLALQNISCQCGRIERLRGRYDLALGRAVASLPRLLGWMYRVKKHQGFPLCQALCYWCGAAPALTHGRPYHCYPLNNIYKEPWFATKQLVYVEL